ncbi:MAG: YbgA family protein, partial [Elusimicrobiota bacterium]
IKNRLLTPKRSLKMLEVKPTILCSKCLGFARCRYNGETIPAPYIEKLSKFCRIITVCPEVDIGLPVPRNPLRLVKKKDSLRFIQSENNIDWTDKMEEFAREFLQGLDEVHGFILKYKSPSCGMSATKYYSSMEKGSVYGKGPGLFGREVLSQFPHYPAETETRLTNFSIREHFLLKLFAFARFYQFKKTVSARDLISFHSANKLLLLAYHQENMRKMGRLIAEQKKKGLKNTLNEYEELLHDSFKTRPSHNAHINVMEHAAGYFSKDIKKSEKKYINELKTDYRNNKVPLSALRAVILSYIIRFNIDYLKEQTYFNPYPSELADVIDSGKGRDLKHI